MSAVGKFIFDFNTFIGPKTKIYLFFSQKLKNGSDESKKSEKFIFSRTTIDTALVLVAKCPQYASLYLTSIHL